MRGLNCRSLRLEMGMGIVALLAASSVFAHATQQNIPTLTTLTATTNDSASNATFTVSVIGDDGQPVTGAIELEENGQQFAGAALNAEGQATLDQALVAGNHAIRAVYTGDASHLASISALQPLITPNCISQYCVAVAWAPPSTGTVTAGQASNGTVTITPVNNGSSTTSTFVTLSCSGLPADSSCVFTPENVEIPAGSNAPVTSDMTIQTEAKSGSLNLPTLHKNTNSIAWALLLPSILGLGWLGRRRALFIRLSLLALACLVISCGTSGCGPRYWYLNHGPPTNPATPSGTYTLTITAQTSNGVTASEENSSLNLTVN